MEWRTVERFDCQTDDGKIVALFVEQLCRETVTLDGNMNATPVKKRLATQEGQIVTPLGDNRYRILDTEEVLTRL